MKRFLQGSVNLLPPLTRRWIRNVPLLAGMQRWLVNQVLSNEPFLHTINGGPAHGLRLEITLPGDKAIWMGTYELEFANALRRGVAKGDVCYDIGGYRGYMTGVLALAGASRVVVCEPLPENVAALQRLTQLNPQLPVKIEQAAVWRADGTATFKVMPDQSMGKLTTSPFQSSVLSMQEIDVQTVRLDTLVFERGWPRPALVKIDVEGAEMEVLAGAARVLAECFPKVYVEAHSADLGNQCTSLLRELGYQIRQLEIGTLSPGQTRHLIATP